MVIMQTAHNRLLFNNNIRRRLSMGIASARRLGSQHVPRLAAMMISTIRGLPASKVALLFMLVAVLGTGMMITGTALLGLTFMLLFSAVVAAAVMVIVVACASLLVMLVTSIPVGYIAYKHGGKVGMFAYHQVGKLRDIQGHIQEHATRYLTLGLSAK
jgi:hypothetical protein